jgi:hypothetical protein
MIRLFVWLGGAVLGVMELHKYGMLHVDAALICSTVVALWIFGGAYFVKRGLSGGAPGVLAEAMKAAKQRAAMGKVTQADGMKKP